MILAVGGTCIYVKKPGNHHKLEENSFFKIN